MKKITILMLLVMMSGINVLFAQSKGDMYVGTLLGMGISKSSTKVGDTKTSDKPYVTMEIDPGFHYFVADNFRIGLQMGLRTSWHKDENDNKNSDNYLLVGPTFAYYFEIADKFYLTPELGFYFAHAKSKDKTGNITNESKGNGFNMQILPVMLEFRPTDHFGFSASLLGIDIAHLKAKDADVKSTGFTFDLGLSPHIGLKYYF